MVIFYKLEVHWNLLVNFTFILKLNLLKVEEWKHFDLFCFIIPQAFIFSAFAGWHFLSRFEITSYLVGHVVNNWFSKQKHIQCNQEYPSSYIKWIFSLTQGRIIILFHLGYKPLPLPPWNKGYKRFLKTLYTHKICQFWIVS